MKKRNHNKYEGFPEKMISYHSKEYSSAMGGYQQDSYQGQRPSEKIAVAGKMAKHHGVGTPAQRKQFENFQKAGQEKRKKGMGTMKKAAIVGGVGAAGTAYVGNRLMKTYTPTIHGAIKGVAKAPFKAVGLAGKGVSKIEKLGRKKVFGKGYHKPDPSLLEMGKKSIKKGAKKVKAGVSKLRAKSFRKLGPVAKKKSMIGKVAKIGRKILTKGK